MQISTESGGDLLPFFNHQRKKFGRSLDAHVDRVLFGSKTMRQSMEEIILAQFNEVKAQEIYGADYVIVEPEEPQEDSPPQPLRLRSGEDPGSEEIANEILVESRRQEGKDADRRAWLTIEQITLRQHKEVYNQNGFPDSSLMSGMYRRAHNPHAGNRPGKSGKSEE